MNSVLIALVVTGFAAVASFAVYDSATDMKSRWDEISHDESESDKEKLRRLLESYK